MKEAEDKILVHVQSTDSIGKVMRPDDDDGDDDDDLKSECLYSARDSKLPTETAELCERDNVRIDVEHRSSEIQHTTRI